MKCGPRLRTAARSAAEDFSVPDRRDSDAAPRTHSIHAALRSSRNSERAWIRSMNSWIAPSRSRRRVDHAESASGTAIPTSAPLHARKHVVTANKGPSRTRTRHWWKSQAGRGRVSFRVDRDDGAPVFNLARPTLPGCKIRGSPDAQSTTNVVIEIMRKGRTLGKELKKLAAWDYRSRRKL